MLLIIFNISLLGTDIAVYYLGVFLGDYMRFSKVVFIASLAMVVFALSGCDLFTAGLGARVDLAPPEIRITSPVNNAYIKYTNGKITISGTVSDDGNIKSVELLWANGKKNAIVTGTTWSVVFENGELPDNRYVFTARATDNSNKVGEWQSTIYVDTNPPTGSFIFKADRGISSENPFNGKEDISGIAEDGSGRLSSVVVKLGGVQIFPTEENPSPDASAMASWKCSIDVDEIVTKSGKWQNIVLEQQGTSTLYKGKLLLAVSDLAGNSYETTEDCYLDLQYDTPRITWPSSMDVISDAAKYSRDPLTFNLNNFRNEDTIEFTVRDDDAVDRSSAILELKKDGTTYTYTVENNGLTASPSDTTKPATDVRFTFKVPQALPQGEYNFSFSVRDDGNYKKEKPVVTTTVSNISFVIDNGAPTLTINPLSSNILRSNACTLSGTASDGWDIEKVQISIDNGANWSDTNLSGSAGNYIWTWDGSGLTEGYYTLQVRAIDKGGTRTLRELQITIDNTPPELSFNQVYPIVESSGKKVNGIIKASVTSADANGLAGVRYWIYTTVPPNETDQTWDGGTDLVSAPYNVSIDTTGLSGTLYIRFGAKDKAGNTKYITYEPLVIDQTTDKPVITLTNLNQSITTWSGAVSNLLESNAQIIGMLSDDDGIDATTVQIRYTDRLNSVTDPLTWGDWKSATSASSTSFQYNFPSNIPEGVLAVEVLVSDKASLKEGKPAVSTTIGPIYIAIDRQSPLLAVNSPSYGDYRGLGTFTIQGTASDSFALKDLDASTPGMQAVIVRNLNNNFDDIANNTVVTVNPDNSWTYSYTVSSGVDETKTFYIKAVDYFNKPTVISHEIRLDTVAPTIAITNPTTPGLWYESSARFDGTANDSTGIKTIYYKVTDSASQPATGDGSWSSLGGNVTWSATVDLSSYTTEGEKYFWIYSEDLAGNISTPISLLFNYDKAKPNVTSDLVEGAYKNSAFEMNLSLSDSYRLKSVIVNQKLNNGSYIKIYEDSSLTGTSASPKISNLPRDPSNPNNSSSVDGEYTYQVIVTDVAGKTTSLERRIIYDDTVPTVAITSFNKYAIGNKVNKTVTFNAIASDANGLEGVKYFVSTSGTNVPAYIAGVGGEIVQVLSSMSIDTMTLTDGSTYYLWVVAKDKAGNEGNAAAQQFVVDQSTDKPVVTVTSLDTAVTTEDKIIDTTTNPWTIKNLLVSGGKISGSIT
jgi:hypothetical protein